MAGAFSSAFSSAFDSGGGATNNAGRLVDSIRVKSLVHGALVGVLLLCALFTIAHKDIL